MDLANSLVYFGKPPVEQYLFKADTAINEILKLGPFFGQISFICEVTYGH